MFPTNPDTGFLSRWAEMLRLFSLYTKLLAVEIPLLSYVENKVADAIIGDNLDDIVKSAAEIELPEFIFDGACE